MQKLVERIDDLSQWSPEAQRVIDWYLGLLSIDPRLPEPTADIDIRLNAYILTFGSVEFWFNEKMQWRFEEFRGDVINFEHAVWLINNNEQI